MRLRGLLALGLLLLAAGAERFAFFGSRVLLSSHLVELGSDSASITATYAMLQGAYIVGTLAGGAAALAVGPRATACAGLFLAALGDLAIAGGAPLVAGAAVAGFGGAMFHPCPYVAAAGVLAWDDESPVAPGPHRFAAVAAFAVALHGVSNLGGTFGPAAGAALREQGWKAMYAGGGVVMLVAAVLAAAATLLGLKKLAPARVAADVGPYRAAPPPGPAPRPPSATLGGLALLFVPAALATVGASVSWPPSQLLSDASSRWVFSVSSVAGMLAALGLFGVLLAAAMQQGWLPPVTFFGAGLVVFALGLAVIGVAGASSLVGYAGGAVLVGIGEAATFTVPIAYASIAVRGRAATLVVAGWFVVTMMVSTAAWSLRSIEASQTPLLWLCALLCAGAGAAIVLQGRRLHEGFFGAVR